MLLTIEKKQEDFQRLIQRSIVRIKRFRQLGLLAWSLLTVAILVLAFQSNLSQSRDEFQAFSQDLYETLLNKVERNEAVLEGVSAFLSSAGEIRHETVHSYAQEILKTYNHIYQIQVAEKVSGALRETYRVVDHHNRDNSWPLKQLEGRANWVPAKPARAYYPVVIIESIGPSISSPLGNDISSPPGFRRLLLDSLSGGEKGTSPVIKLQESGYAYILVKPIIWDPAYSAGLPREQAADAYVNILVRPDALFSSVEVEEGVYSFKVVHEDFSHASFVNHQQADRGGSLEKFLFPELTFEQSVDKPHQPLRLTVTRQVTFEDFDWHTIILTVVTMSLLLMGFLYYANSQLALEQSRIRHDEEMFMLANEDNLTQLPNRAFLMEAIGEMIEKARHSKQIFGVLYLDIDNFKLVNDTFGHDAGDELLVAFADALKQIVRATDIVGRLAGDEFIVLLPGIEDKMDAEVVKEDITVGVASVFASRKEFSAASISSGLAIYPDDGVTVEAIVRTADHRMYEEKPRDGDQDSNIFPFNREH